MKRVLLFVLCMTALLLLMSGCQCKHEWQEGDCLHPKTCSKCGVTEGGPVHRWEEANCEEPKHCTICVATEGEVYHPQWLEADCENPKHCALCKFSVEEPLGHKFKEATCIVPKECTVCGHCEGEVAEHKITGVTCVDPGYCTVCGQQGKYVADHQYSEATCVSLPKCQVCGLELGSRGPHDMSLPTLTTPSTCAICGQVTGGVYVPVRGFDRDIAAPYAGVWTAQWNADGEQWFGVTVEGVDLDFTASITMNVTDYGLIVLDIQYDKDFYRKAAVKAEEARIYQDYMDRFGISREEVPDRYYEETRNDLGQYLLEYEANTLQTESSSQVDYYVQQDGYFWAGRSSPQKVTVILEGETEFRDGKLILEEKTRGKLEFVKAPSNI